MTREEFEDLKAGDIVKHRSDKLNSYIVTSNFGNRVTAVKTVDLTNPQEWKVVSKCLRKNERMKKILAMEYLEEEGV